MSQNKKFRKFAAASLAATATVVAVAPAVAAAQFDDVTENNVHADNISKLVEAGVITGYPNGEFRPAESIQRRHVAVMLFRQFELEAPADVEAVLADYTDVSSDDLYADEIAAVIEAGFFKGSNGEFMPTENFSREQMATVLVRAFALEDNGVDVDVYLDNVDPSHQANVKILAQHGLTTELDDFRPKEDVQRGQFASFTVRTVEATAAPAVESVSAINQTTLEVTGEGLKNLKAEDVTVADNKVTDVKVSADGKTATLTLQAALVSEQETKVTIKESEESTKEFTVTYKLAVTSVSIDDQLFDDDRANQKVKFKINGVEADIDYLTLHGYSVTFVAKDANGEATADLFGANTSSTGVIDNPAVIGVYTVEVQVTKSGEALVTDTAKISVVNLDAQTSALEDPVFYNHATGGDDSSAAYGAEGTADDDLAGDDFVQNSKTFVAGESFELLRLHGTVAGEKELIPEGSIEVKSSNDAVVSVGANNVLTAESAGTATLTFTVGSATKTVNVTVTNTKRELTKVTADPTSLKLVQTYSKSVTLKSTDQYGDPYKVEAADVTEVVPQVNATDIVSGTITELETDTADSIGTMTATVTGDVVGKGSVFFKDATTDKVLGSVLVDVSAVDNQGALKLERIGGTSKDNTLELGSDTTVVYELARYNTQGVYIEGVDLEDKIIEVVDGTIATAQFQDNTGTVTGTATTATAKAEITGAAGDVSLVITGTKAGKTDILLKDVASGKQEKLTITVTENPFKVTNVDFKTAPKVDYAGAVINYTNVLNVIESNDDDILTGITLNKATQHKVRISEDGGTGGAEGVVYLDTDADGVYTSGTDTDLGFVELTATSSSTLANAPIADVVAGYTTAATDKGTLLFKFLTDVTGADATTAIKATSVQVEVK